jgi:hypothetical protein
LHCGDVMGLLLCKWWQRLCTLLSLSLQYEAWNRHGSMSLQATTPPPLRSFKWWRHTATAADASKSVQSTVCKLAQPYSSSIYLLIYTAVCCTATTVIWANIQGPFLGSSVVKTFPQNRHERNNRKPLPPSLW